jgi:hypothetical protein
MALSSFLARMNYGTNHLGPQRSALAVNEPSMLNRGPVGFMVNKGEKLAAGYLLGYAKGKYRDKLLVWGQPAEMLGGVALTALAAIFKIHAGSRGVESTLAPHIESFGDAALITWMNGLGSVAGHKSAGRKMIELPAGADTSKLPAGATVVSGLSDKIKPGRFLSDDEISHWTAPR